MKLKTLLFLVGGSLILLGSTATHAQTNPIVLIPDSITGDFVATVNSATNDSRLDRVCLFRVDVNSADPTAEVACLPVSAGRAPEAGEEVPSGEGLVFEIQFTATLVVSQDQLFVARNIGIDTNVEIVSEISTNEGRIPGRIGPPMFVIRAPVAP